MKKILKEKIEFIFGMHRDLLHTLRAENYAYKLKGLRSNTIGSQLLCVAGARESYYKSILGNEGFKWTCSFDGKMANVKTELDRYMGEYEKEIIKFIEDTEEISSNQTSLILDLLSHEYLHQGQMIRYLYANHLPIPKSWKDFWHLED